MNGILSSQNSLRETAKPYLPWRYAIAGVISIMALTACGSINRVNDSVKAVDGHTIAADEYLADMRNRPDLVGTRSTLRQMEALWVDKTPQSLNSQSLGAPETALDCKLTFNPKVPVTLNEFARVATNLCGLSIQITTDANAAINGTLQGVQGMTAIDNDDDEDSRSLPSPALGAAASQASLRAAFAAEGTGMISGISWVNKPLSGLLDLVTNRLGLGWKFKDNTATIFYTDTRIFRLYAISGKTTLETTVRSGVQKGSSSGAEASTFSSDGSVQETGITFETDIIADIEKTLETMITPGLGRMSVSASTGTVAVTDRPDVLSRIEKYLDGENKRITRQVLLNVKVLSIQVNDNDSLGLNWDVVYKTIHRSASMNTGFTSITGGISAGMGIVDAGSRGNGSELLVQALAQQGRVSTLSSPSIMTLNMKPAPILVGTQTTYLAEISTTAIEGGGTSQQALTPGNITTGFNMTLLPYLMEGPELLLQYSINLSALTGMKTAESGDNRIEMPEVDNRIFSQSVRLKSGQTLVLSGFDQTVTNARKEGVGSPDMWILGGHGARQNRRDVLVVLITPIITD